MYAVIEAGGKQYRVEKGEVIDIERQDKEEGQSLSFDEVLLVAAPNNVLIGQPYVKGARVSAEVVKNLRGPKVISYKYRRRKSSHWKKGHRQFLTRIVIKDIEIPKVASRE